MHGFDSTFNDEIPSNVVSHFQPIPPFNQAKFQYLISKTAPSISKLQFLGGFAIFELDGSLPIIIGQNQNVLEDFNVVKNTIEEISPREFFETVPDTLKKGNSGHITFEFFHLYFISIHPLYTLAFFVIDDSPDLISKIREVKELIVEIFNMDISEFKSAEIESKSPSPRVSPSPRAPTGVLTNNIDEDKDLDPEVTLKEENNGEIKRNTKSEDQSTSIPINPSERKEFLKNSLKQKLEKLEG